MFENLNKLLILLSRAISVRKLYFDAHPKVTSITKEFITKLNQFFIETELERLFIGVVDNHLVFEGRNLIGPSITGKQFILFSKKLQCGGFSFDRGISEEEFRTFLTLTIDLKAPVKSLGEARELLLSKGIGKIEIAAQYIDPGTPLSKDMKTVWHGEDTGDFLYSPTMVYQALFDTVAQAHSDVAGGDSIDIDSTRSVSEIMLHYIRASFSDLLQHVHYPDYDSYTVGHSVRVSALAVFLAHSLKWDEETLLSIGTAGLLHDVGKSKIPDEILLKPGKLSDDEFKIVMQHSQVGAEILLGHKNATNLDIAAAWGHHIRHDNSGYPKPPSWAARHPLTSLLQICDAFEALTAIRPYKPILTPQIAYSIMLKDKGAFHPGLLATFIAALGIYPPGNRVRLSDGSEGVVTKVGKKIDRPEIQVTHSSSGIELSAEDQYPTDLGNKENQHLKVDELILPTKEDSKH